MMIRKIPALVNVNIQENLKATVRNRSPDIYSFQMTACRLHQKFKFVDKSATMTCLKCPNAFLKYWKETLCNFHLEEGKYGPVLRSGPSRRV